MTAWVLSIGLAILAWRLGVRQGRRSREADAELAYRLGVADGRRQVVSHRRPPSALEDEKSLVEAAVEEVAIVRGAAASWAEQDERG
jgi:hypothetical protein